MYTYFVGNDDRRTDKLKKQSKCHKNICDQRFYEINMLLNQYVVLIGDKSAEHKMNTIFSKKHYINPL